MRYDLNILKINTAFGEKMIKKNLCFLFFAFLILFSRLIYADVFSLPEEKINKCRFGTIANFRQYSGSPNFTNGKIYLGVDSDKFLKNQVYRFIGPDGMPVFQSNDWKKLLRQQPDSATREWWDFELKQMIDAGLNFLAIDSFGLMKPYECDECSQSIGPNCMRDSHNCPLQPEFQAEALKKILAEEQLPLQIGLFVDTPGPWQIYNWERLKKAYGKPAEWCKYLWRGTGEDPKGIIQPMPITPENALRYFYQGAIYPFYSHFNDPNSRSHWLIKPEMPLKQ